MTAKRVRVDQIASWVRRTVEVKPNNSYTMLGVKSFGRGAFVSGTISGSGTAYRQFQVVQSGDLVYPKLMAWEGAFAVAGGELAGKYVSPEFCTFEFDADKVDSRFVRHWVLSDAFLASVTGHATGTNVRRRRLQPAAFLRTEIPLPGLDEQRTIAARLDRISAVASDCETAATADLRTTVLRERIMSHALNYPQAAIGTVLTPTSDPIQVVPDGRYPDAGILNRGRGMFGKPVRLGSATKYSKLDQIHAGQLIYSKLFAWEGSVAIVPHEFDKHYVSPEFPNFNIETAIVDTGFLGCAVRTASFAAQLADAGSGMGQRRQRVNVARFLTLTIPVPPLAVQQRIAKAWSSVDMADTLLQRRHRLATALPRAARNEVFASL